MINLIAHNFQIRATSKNFVFLVLALFCYFDLSPNSDRDTKDLQNLGIQLPKEGTANLVRSTLNTVLLMLLSSLLNANPLICQMCKSAQR
jgi:hypothetical protein